MRTVKIRQFFFLLCIFIFCVFSSTVINGADILSNPAFFQDPSSIAVNETFSYDDDNGTFAKITTSSSGNVSFAQFETGSGHITSLGIFFDLRTTNFSDDTWTLEYSDDNESSWNTLKLASNETLSRQILNYSNIGSEWTWADFAANFSVRVAIVTVGAPDNANFFLYELWSNLTVDIEGPIVNLTDPLDSSLYGGITLVNFSYNVSDTTGIENCSLYINGLLNTTNTSPVEGSNNFSITVGDGNHLWNVFCWDNATPANNASSSSRTIIVDDSAPNISLIVPAAESTLAGSSIVTFRYGVQDWSSINNCSIFLNNTLNQTLYGDDALWPSNEAEFLIPVSNGFWEWHVNCTDIWNYSGVSAVRNFTQSANDEPRIHNILIQDYITLLLGGNVTVWCNASISDTQGQGTIDTVTAYLHRADWSYNATDETSAHHTSSTCSSVGVNSTTIDYQCSFSLPYYARAMNWTCTYEATDELGYVGFGKNTTSIEPLFAFNITPPYIPYGIVKAGNVSDEQSVTIQNLGNAELDMALDGYAQVDGDGLAMVCDVGNTTIGNERYTVSSGTPWSSMTPLSDEEIQVDPFNLPPRNDSFNGEAELYWRIRLGVPQKGNCSGFVTFAGVQS